jgi:DNA-binding NarL/FixJ family response regulator
VSIRLLIADDHPVVRDGLRAMLDTQNDMEVVGEAATGSDAVARARVLRPDVVLMDLQMPPTSTDPAPSPRYATANPTCTCSC